MPGTIGVGELLKDRYRLERTLGRGGMAAVWLGHDEVLERPVAVKVLSDTIASDPGFVARFRREAQTAAGLSHPNLVGVYDFSEEDERPYLVMQFVPGESLAARLERGGGVDCDKLARELLDAVAHIHGVGILHRDIKPGNIVIEPDGTAKLIDFGIALPRDATSLTSTGLVLGTERYAAPEVMEGQPATERSDLYSCGLVLRSCEGQCSRALGVLVEAMTSKDPRSRPLSARQALERLEQPEVEVEEPTQVFEAAPTRRTEPLLRNEEGPPPPPPPARSRSGSGGGRKAAIAAVLGLFAALAVVAAFALGGGEDDPRSGGNGGERAAQRNGGKDEQAQTAGAVAGDPEEQASQPTASREETEPDEEAEQSATPEESEASPAVEPEATDPALGVSLNEEGFALIQAGEHEAAVPILEDAVAAFPEGSEDVNYAYALFNLGNALRLSGRPEEAIPYLEQRLQFPSQEGEVREELEAAEAEAG
ncbi:MAG TPA: serine/threonine-protein kinase [Solirubrobacterales bacterium]|nr:serine/threonine-protein kinase [Solirubrobacterales bacterium]